MTNEEKSIFWFESSQDNLETAEFLLNSKRKLDCCFYCHLVVEKILKALILANGNSHPNSHNLNRLAELAGILEELSPQQIDLLNILYPYQIEARYPEHKSKLVADLSFDKTKSYFTQTKEFYKWALNKSKKA